MRSRTCWKKRCCGECASDVSEALNFALQTRSNRLIATVYVVAMLALWRLARWPEGGESDLWKSPNLTGRSVICCGTTQVVVRLGHLGANLRCESQ